MPRDYKSKHIDISIILTGYNEGPTLLEHLIRVKDFLAHSKYRWEMILYDDGSHDDTLKVFREFAAKNKNIKAFLHQKNKGRGATVRDAIVQAKGEVVGYIDTDLELSPVYIFEFFKEIKDGADIAIGTRFYTLGAWNFVRTILSKGYIILLHLFLGLPFRDTEAGFKFFNRKKVLPLLRKVKDERWFFDTEIIARGYWAGLKITEVPIVYIRNKNKQSSVKLFKDTWDYFKKLWNFRKTVFPKR